MDVRTSRSYLDPSIFDRCGEFHNAISDTRSRVSDSVLDGIQEEALSYLRLRGCQLYLDRPNQCSRLFLPTLDRHHQYSKGSQVPSLNHFSPSTHHFHDEPTSLTTLEIKGLETSDWPRGCIYVGHGIII